MMLLFYVPCPDQGTAEKIATTLMNEKLVACANIIPGMKSLYWWEGQLEQSLEFVLILKALEKATTRAEVTKRIEDLHPYEVPCVITLETAGVNESYHRWLLSLG